MKKIYVFAVLLLMMLLWASCSVPSAAAGGPKVDFLPAVEAKYYLMLDGIDWTFDTWNCHELTTYNAMQEVAYRSDIIVIIINDARNGIVPATKSMVINALASNVKKVKIAINLDPAMLSEDTMTFVKGLPAGYDIVAFDMLDSLTSVEYITGKTPVEFVLRGGDLKSTNDVPVLTGRGIRVFYSLNAESVVKALSTPTHVPTSTTPVGTSAFDIDDVSFIKMSRLNWWDTTHLLSNLKTNFVPAE